MSKLIREALADPLPPMGFFALAGRGFLSEQLNNRLDPASCSSIQFAQLTSCRGAELDPVGHASPKSALTSSQGILQGVGKVGSGGWLGE